MTNPAFHTWIVALRWRWLSTHRGAATGASPSPSVSTTTVPVAPGLPWASWRTMCISCAAPDLRRSGTLWRRVACGTAGPGVTSTLNSPSSADLTPLLTLPLTLACRVYMPARVRTAESSSGLSLAGTIFTSQSGPTARPCRSAASAGRADRFPNLSRRCTSRLAWLPARTESPPCICTRHRPPSTAPASTRTLKGLPRHARLLAAPVTATL
mmetsp:Transcript_46804/g.89380  ORF Transcript_46804/g.89380 Transcript_46804/m.89380 type:complete len:212 (-) Transcript_46804:26-661(-)